MATKTISITEEAYERLKTRKDENDSFSDVIYKITSKRSLLEIAGSLSKEEASKMDEEIKKARDLSNNRAKTIAKILKK